MADRTMAVTVVMMIVATSAPTVVAASPLHVWNSDPLKVEGTRGAAGDTAGPLGPISIVGVRNGWFSGKVVAKSSGPITGLSATMSDLTGDAGKIDAASVQVRYGTPWVGANRRYTPRGLDILLDSAPSGQSVVTVWVTVKIPKDARPGLYRGELTINAAAAAAVTAAVELKVVDWALPDTDKWTTWVELVQSPDTLAVEYGVPLWSDEHWRMMAQSFKLIGEMGSRVVYVPLICYTNNGNAESMVRWVAQGDGGYTHDYSIMDRYLDLATQHMGQPKIVVLNAWDVYLNTPGGETIPDDEMEDQRRHVMAVKKMRDARRALAGKGPVVSVTTVDPAGAVGTVNLPRYEDPACLPLWKPVWSQVRQNLTGRGLADTMMLGMVSDSWPNQAEVEALKDITGGLPWVSHCHFSATKRKGGGLYGIASIDYESTVWDIELVVNPAEQRRYGWSRDEFVTAHYRKGAIGRMSPSQLRVLAEMNITGNQRGIGRVGGDLWYAVKDKRGGRAGMVTDRYPQSLWRNLDVRGSLLAPGPSGPVATIRYEILREGIQECEARIMIERALIDDAKRAKLGAELAARCQTLLDERQRCLWKAQGLTDEEIELTGLVTNRNKWEKSRNRGRSGPDGQTWFLKSGYQQRNEALFALAGEVAARLNQD